MFEAGYFNDSYSVIHNRHNKYHENFRQCSYQQFSNQEHDIYMLTRYELTAVTIPFHREMCGAR